jgi:hypothetical protein
MGLHLGSNEKCHSKRRYKDFLIFFEWFDNTTDTLGEGEPTMFITRANRFALSGNRSAVAIPMAQGYLHADSKTGGPTPHLLMFCVGGCKELGLEPSRMNIRHLADAIVDNLPDLLRMPPAPSKDKFKSRSNVPIGEAKVMLDGEVIRETEVMED